MSMPFAAIAPDGTLLDVVATLPDALATANSAGYERVMYEEHPPQQDEALLNDASVEDMSHMALRATGLSPLSQDEVNALTKQEAHRRLLPYLPKTHVRNGVVSPISSYQTVSDMTRRWLGQNYKTAKETPEQPSDVQGLSLVPHGIIRDFLKGNTITKTLCLGSSPACRAACLVYSGQNAADPYNLQIKLGRTHALLAEPAAFMRILVESIGMHLRAAPEKPWVRNTRGAVEHGRGVQQYFRLNVFQDIPWELFTPWLFDYKLQHRDGVVDFSRASFYDYTKVPGRRPPRNYDLTFSFSGVNHHLVDQEIHRGRRIAVVFLLPGAYRQRRTATLPTRYMGYQVVDGDVSDVRPRDPAPAVVGLRWKLPKGTPTGRDQVTSAFVVPCQEIDGQLVATQSARQEPIIDVDDEDPEQTRWLKVWAD